MKIVIVSRLTGAYHALRKYNAVYSELDRLLDHCERPDSRRLYRHDELHACHEAPNNQETSNRGGSYTYNNAYDSAGNTTTFRGA